MIGFSIEFKKWFIVIRGPKGKIYMATGFSKHMPVFTPTGTYTSKDFIFYPTEDTEDMEPSYN